MIKLISRAEWGARPPKETVRLDWSRVIYFVIHYSGANRAQSVRSIQDYCMDTKKHVDIDYNELIRDGDVYAGRMDNAGGHTLGLNSQSYGVCVIGKDGDGNDLDLIALQERYAYACGRAGRILTIVGHRNAPGQKSTSCPGSEILGWISAGQIDDKPATPPAGPGGDWTEDIMKGLPTARLGHHDRKTVKTIQGLMNRDAEADNAAQLLVDGVWGPRTDNRVRGWQAAHKVPNSVRSDGTGDGAFGPQSWRHALDLD